MSFFESLEYSALGDWVATSYWGYPALLTAHSKGLAIVVGILFALNMRILGAFPGIELDAMRRMLRLAWAGFGLNLASGTALFVAQASFFITHIAFQIKIAAIFLAIIDAALIQSLLKNNATDWDSGEAISGKARLLAVVSLLLWLTAIIAGRLIAYIE